MALIRWEPFRDLEHIFDMDSRPLQRLGWDLAVDVYDKDNTVIAEMHLPGIDPEKLDISVERDHMRISGSREEGETKDRNYYSREITRGSFERIVQLPTEVDGNQAEAEYKEGVLKVTVPKKGQQPASKIKVRVNK